MSIPIIRISHLSKNYRIGALQPRYRTLRETITSVGKNLFSVNRKSEDTRLWALDDVSCEIHPGEVVGLIGRNGAGKSTLLKLLSHITSPSCGRIELNGRIGSLLEVGTGFHPELTGHENIYLNGAILGMKRAEIRKKFDEIVSFAELEQFVDTPVKFYSSGMYMRLAFAVAAHLETEILLVDEVLAVGDVEFQKKCMGKMGDVAREGRTILFVSHNMTAITNLCHRAILLKQGKVEFDGDVVIGVRKYLNDVNQDLLGEDARRKISNLPEDPILKLLSFRVSQPGRINSSFLSSQDIEISIEYTVNQRINGLRVGFDLITQENGAVVFRTFYDDADSSKRETTPGAYISTAVIPANLLAPKTYIASLAIGIHNIRWIIYEQIALPVTVMNIGGVNANYADVRPGMIMPHIHWTTVEKGEE